MHMRLRCRAQVCVTEGEDVSTSMQAIAQAVLALVLLFPALRSHLTAAIGKVTDGQRQYISSSHTS